MGNCTASHRPGDLRLISASVQVLSLNSGDATSTTPSPSPTTTPSFLSKKKPFSPAPSLGTKNSPAASSPETTTTTTTSTEHSVAQDLGPATTTEIVLASPLPHSRFCKRLRMRRTPDWDRVVLPLVTPGARLKVVYDPATLMIHVLERDDSHDSPSTGTGTTTSAKAANAR